MLRNSTLRATTFNPDSFPLRVAREKVRNMAPGRRGIRVLIWAAMGGAAAYFMLPQMGQLGETLRALDSVRPGWVAAGTALVVIRYVLAALSLQLAIGKSISFVPTLLVQLSSSFIGRLTPEGVGWLVLNQRYLEKSGLGRASAVAGITLKLLAGGLVRMVVMGTVAVLAGTSGIFQLPVPRGGPYLLAIALGLALLGLILGMGFRSPLSWVLRPVLSGARELATIFHQPRRAVALFATSAGITLSYGLVLVASVRAFGVDISLFEVFVVYLVGTAVASASPTPGNLGAVEVALSAGLTTMGVASAPAVGAVMIYRLLTFWLPVLPGFLAFHQLQKQELI